MKVIDHMSKLIGRTPILVLPVAGTRSRIYLKLEMMNPCGSMKDRMARCMLDDALTCSEVETIVESSSGNTAGAMAMLCAEKRMGFKAIVDSHASKDKLATINAFGGSCIYVGGEEGILSTKMRDDTAEKTGKQSGHFWTAQHDNNYNAMAYKGLAMEIIQQIDNIDYLVSPIGTGGSICGTSFFLKNSFPNLMTVAVEPEGSVIFGGTGHNYYQSGTGTPQGANIGIVIDYTLIDYGLKVSDRIAFNTSLALARSKGLLTGGSTGGALYHALKIAEEHSEKELNILTLACDSGFKYMDTIYNPSWMTSHDLTSESIQKNIKKLLD